MSAAFWKTVSVIVGLELLLATVDFLFGVKGDLAAGLASLALYRTFSASAPSTPEGE